MFNVISKSFSATCFYGKTAGKSGIGKRTVFSATKTNALPSQYGFNKLATRDIRRFDARRCG
jgi:hypothetical protein